MGKLNLSTKDFKEGFVCNSPKCGATLQSPAEKCLVCKSKTVWATCPICGLRTSIANCSTHPCKIDERLIIANNFNYDESKPFNLIFEQNGVGWKSLEISTTNQKEVTNRLLEILRNVGVSLETISSSEQYKEDNRKKYLHNYKKGYDSGISKTKDVINNRMQENQHLLEGLNISGNQIVVLKRILTEEKNVEVTTRRNKLPTKIHNLHSSLHEYSEEIFMLHCKPTNKRIKTNDYTNGY